MIGRFILEVTIFIKLDLCGEYRQPIAQVGGAHFYSQRLWPVELVLYSPDLFTDIVIR